MVKYQALIQNKNSIRLEIKKLKLKTNLYSAIKSEDLERYL